MLQCWFPWHLETELLARSLNVCFKNQFIFTFQLYVRQANYTNNQNTKNILQCAEILLIFMFVILPLAHYILSSANYIISFAYDIFS